jgi:hypothetical protein
MPKLWVIHENGTLCEGSNFGVLMNSKISHAHIDYPHQGECKLIAEPTMNGHKSPGWVLGITDIGIILYYKKIIENRFGIKIDPPMWNAHISVVRGEGDPEKIWKLHKQKKTFFYTHDVFTNGQHWWLNVISDELVDVREMSGTFRGSGFFHLTIGRTQEKSIL